MKYKDGGTNIEARTQKELCYKFLHNSHIVSLNICRVLFCGYYVGIFILPVLHLIFVADKTELMVASINILCVQSTIIYNFNV